MQSDYAKDGKTAAIVAYITIVGTIIAFFMNNDSKNNFAYFHIRQAFGLWITYFLLGALVSMFDSWFVSAPFYLFIIVLILFGLVTAMREEEKEVPILGPYFQEWFNFIK